ncbi:hypothetical protein [Cohnella massiliensis]|nr:hypothetical protein [Cohnella massiliensis]
MSDRYSINYYGGDHKFMVLAERTKCGGNHKNKVPAVVENGLHLRRTP